jgi:hypothetical protein
MMFLFLGLFEPNHMQYDLDRDTSASGEPSLAEMTKTAIEILSKGDNGYFLLVEGRMVHKRALDSIDNLTKANFLHSFKILYIIDSIIFSSVFLFNIIICLPIIKQLKYRNVKVTCHVFKSNGYKK